MSLGKYKTDVIQGLRKALHTKRIPHWMTELVTFRPGPAAMERLLEEERLCPGLVLRVYQAGMRAEPEAEFAEAWKETAVVLGERKRL